MIHYLKITLALISVSVLLKNSAKAQDTLTGFEAHHNIYISFGAGSSFLNDLPSDIYRDGNTNLQLGAQYERAFHKRFSLLTGLEFEQLVYSFDGDIEFTSPSTLDIVPAGPEKKYTGIRQRNLAIPLQLRTYFLDNNGANRRNMFLQGGFRFVQTLDFIGASGLRSVYFFRSEGEDDGVHLSDFANQTLLQTELMIGFKGQFFKKFDLLNASTLGIMYQFTPMLSDGSTRIAPLYLTWRFLF